MKQKVVIKVSMHCQKCYSKALKNVVGASGVESAAIKGEDKSQIEIIGDGMDAVELATSLKKKFKYAELVSVGPAGDGPKKEEEKENKATVEVKPVDYWSYYQGGMPYYDYRVVYADPYYPSNCFIM
ncbi:disease resistance protein RGA5-like [Pistacia vera]|uniref:disease resistance protein RGA5-like n=1 Tax=Pistacia vera TaxID=55513 RepID=UPI0012636C29|nr:disease resistance protein RGA5-like [Pistacia vera]